MLCRVCQRLFKRQWPLRTDSRSLSAPQDHHSSLESFYSSVEEGCQICTVLFDSPKIQERVADLTATHTSHLLVCQREIFYPTPNPGLRCFQLNFIADNELNGFSKRPHGDADGRFEVVPPECKSSLRPENAKLKVSFRLPNRRCCCIG
jgi:hypothetical protein